MKVYQYCFPSIGEKSNKLIIDLVTKQAVFMPEKEAKICFGMSKMTVVDEPN